MNNKYKNSSKLSVTSVIWLFLIIVLVFCSVFFIPVFVEILKGKYSSLVNSGENKNPLTEVAGVDLVLLAVDVEEELLIDGRGSKDAKLIARAIVAGYNDAKAQHVTTHAECKKVKVEFAREGCERYVIAQKHFPPHVRQGDFEKGKKPEQCVAEVNAYYNVFVADLIEQEKDSSAIAKVSAAKQSELEDCDLYDSTKAALVKNKPLLHVNHLIEKVEQNGAGSDQDLILILNDVIDVVNFKDNAERNEFTANAQHFIKVVDTEVKAGIPLSCDQMQEKADVLLSIQKGMESTIIQKLRWQDKLWEYKRSLRKLLLWHRVVLIDKAKTAGCVINDPANS